jgi:hypothetical protein
MWKLYRIHDFGQNRWARDELPYFSEPVPVPYSTIQEKKTYLRLLWRKEGPCFAAIQLGHQIVPITVLHKIDDS